MKRSNVITVSVLLGVLCIAVTAQAQVPGNPTDRVRELESQLDRLAVVVGRQGFVQSAPQRRIRNASGAWWTDTALVAHLGLSDDQKAQIERTFENHREKIISTTDLLEKEESHLARLLDAEPIDRNAILSQTDRVIQARGEMERANAAMTLEMREHLTRAQWMQLPRSGPAFYVIPQEGRGGRGAAPVATPGATPGLRGRGGRGGRGQ
jgi:Spy/CpxP family protein refolding chaperone